MHNMLLEYFSEGTVRRDKELFVNEASGETYIPDWIHTILGEIPSFGQPALYTLKNVHFHTIRNTQQ
ncbi:hypothetical protein QR721_03760 [Aciduricibacillus chroicocephali]|uniref:Uncharacterized protein n=1 Tax=Aciduricibacillus chroicocephali TaxID=3054939 RepID=A0ABY9KXI9_9BACI|nr:hypothetical protein QR721_03760 [Bacillaceae bacterium 44XB]